MFPFPQSHGGSFGRVEPSEGEVPPESQLELSVVAHLRDVRHFQAKLEVTIRHGQAHTVLLSATGTGATIVSDRPFAPNLDLGANLRYNDRGRAQIDSITNHTAIYNCQNVALTSVAVFCVSRKPFVMSVPLQADQPGEANLPDVLAVCRLPAKSPKSVRLIRPLRPAPHLRFQ